MRRTTGVIAIAFVVVLVGVGYAVFDIPLWSAFVCAGLLGLGAWGLDV